MADLAQIRAGFVGLTTARSPEAAPNGGLLEAENVCIRTENVITPRPPFRLQVFPAALATEAVGRVEYPISDNTKGLMIDASATRWDDDGTAVTTEDAAALTWETYEGAVARRSLFVCTGDALRAIHTPGATVAYRAGVPAPAIAETGLNATTVTSALGPAFPAAGYRGYRAVTKRQASTSQSHEARSAPSALFVAYRSASGNQNMYLLLHKGEDFIAGDEIELYATEYSETYPVDELYLNQTVAVTSAHIAAGFIEIADDVPNDNLGAALYTNASREGAESGNYRPPQAGCLGTYRNSLWLGDLTYPAQMLLSAPISAYGFAAVDDSEIGAHGGVGGLSGSFTNGSVNVTGLSAGDVAHLRVGMLITNASADWAGRVATVGATSFTLAAVWAGSTAVQSFRAHDTIRIGSEYYPVRDIVADIRGVKSSRSTNDLAANPSGSTLYTAEWVSNNENAATIQETNADSYVRVELLLAAILPSTTPPQVWATRGDLYSPALPEPSAATGLTMEQEILPDHVAWSKYDEPDHFPLTNIDRVGRPGSTVMGLGESRNAIVIATDMGLWRGSGHADSGMSFDEVDKDVRVLGRRCMAPVGAKQYVAADKGVYECDENEALNITHDRINNLEALFKLIAPARASALKVVANAKDDEVIVCAPDSETAGADINAWYVFNTETRAWTKWVPPLPVLDVTVKGRAQTVVATLSGVEGELREDPTTYDANPTGVTAVTVDAVTGTTVTLATAHGFGFVVGDAIESGGSLYLVTAIATQDSLTVHKTGMTTGAKFAWKAIACTITPTVNTLKTPRLMKLWADGALHWAKRSGVYAYELAFRSAITGANTAATATRVLAPAPATNTDARSAPSTNRFTVARAAARGTHLCFTVTIRQAGADWAIEALSVRARTTADKAPARLP